MKTNTFRKNFFFVAALAWAGLTWAAEAPSKPDEALVIVVHKSNPVENLTLDELRKLCLGERSRWDNQKRVTVVLREPGQAERETVLKKIYEMNEQEFRRHFLQSTYTGGGQNTPKQLATDTGVRRFVFNVSESTPYHD